jgi:hypothetical protein
MSFTTIRKYLQTIQPTLLDWAQHGASLREITPQHVSNTLNSFQGSTAKSLTCRPSEPLFRARKQERLVFLDPARGVSLPKSDKLPSPLATDRPVGLIDRTVDPLTRLVLALVAIHALGKSELPRLLLSNLDLARARLAVDRLRNRHTLYLDELTHVLAADWLRERQRRWPLSTNAHLLVSQQTAVDPVGPPWVFSPSTGVFAHWASRRRCFVNTGLLTRLAIARIPSTACAYSASPTAPRCGTCTRPIPNAAQR